MRVPKKIFPDRLKDAIVEIHYANFLPLELIPGVIFHLLDDTYTYASAPLHLDKKVFSSYYPHTSSSIIFNDNIKVLLRRNSFIFNFLNTYIGWDEYSKEIRKFIKAIIEARKEPIEFNRASVRYISEYPDLDLEEGFKFEFTYGMPHIQSDKFTIRSEFSQDDMLIFLNLQNSIELTKQDEDKSASISIVDIDVLKEDFKTSDLTELLKIITSVHDKQKEIFFSIIKEDFLKTLKPEY